MPAILSGGLAAGAVAALGLTLIASVRRRRRDFALLKTLGFTRRQQIWQIILPQSIRRMIPPWMNLYAILATSTTLASVVGVNEVVTLAGQVLAAEGNRPSLLAPLYGYVLLMFFLYTYPVAWVTQRLERRYQVRN